VAPPGTSADAVVTESLPLRVPQAHPFAQAAEVGPPSTMPMDLGMLAAQTRASDRAPEAASPPAAPEGTPDPAPSPQSGLFTPSVRQVPVRDVPVRRPEPGAPSPTGPAVEADSDTGQIDLRDQIFGIWGDR
jgi:hypothetical protein